jgi:hypothetical protein
LSFDKTQYLIDIINSIEFIQWNKAKSIWILMFLFDVYSIDCDCVECKNIFSRNEISTFGSEYEFFLEPIIQIQEYTFLSMCSIECDLNNITKKSVALTFEKDKKKVNLFILHINFHAEIVEVMSTLNFFNLKIIRLEFLFKLMIVQYTYKRFRKY